MNQRPGPPPDFRAVFEALPTPFLVLLPGDGFPIAAVSDAYLRATSTTREGILGRGLFEVFPDNPEDPHADGVANLRASLDRVSATGVPDRLPIQRYDIRRPEGGFEERHWSPLNTPVLSPGGEVAHIIHHVEDVTEFVRLTRAGVEQKLVEAALRETSDWFSTTLASIGDAVIATDIDGRVAFMNGVAEGLTGWRAVDAAGLPIERVFRVVEESTGATAGSPVETVLREGEVVGLLRPLVLIARDGTERPIEDSAAPIKAGGGRTAGIVVVFRDVTEKRRSDLALAASEEFNRSVLASSPDCLKLLDLDGRLLSMNEFGFCLMEIDDIGPWVGREWAGFWPEEAREGVMAALATAREGRVASFQGFCPTAKGTARWWDVSVSPVLDSLGKPVRILAASRDITESKRAEEQLRTSGERFRMLFDSMEEGFCVIEVLTDADGRPVDYRFLEVNPAFERQTGLRDATGKRIREFDPDIEPFWYEAYGRVAATGEPARFVNEVKAMGRWFDVDAFRIGGPEERKVAVFFRDITPRIRAEQERERLVERLREDDSRKDEFLAMLAHELRNPLAAIGNAVRLATASERPEHVGWALDVVARQLQHLTRLIDDLLDVSRITRGKIELRRELVDASAILESAAATVRPLVEERRHTLDLDIDRDDLWVDADPTRLEQVVVNLLNNAAKYSDDAGQIRLSARREGADVAIVVADKGVGIAPESLPRMFELFAQGDRSLARSEGGLGIGLTVVKKLVEMHGGTVTARSEGAGAGSEFAIRLPGATRPDVPGEEPARPSTGTSRRSRVLVVDDNVDTARGMSRLLKLVGHEVSTAHDGPEAIELARACRPEFILLDIGLPGMSGYEVATALRREAWCGESVIVAVSGYGQEEDRRRSRESGFDYHFLKPLDHDALLALLSSGKDGRA